MHPWIWNYAEVDRGVALVERTPTIVEPFTCGAQALAPEEAATTTTVGPDQQVVVAGSVVGHGRTTGCTGTGNLDRVGEDWHTCLIEALGGETATVTPTRQELTATPADHAPYDALASCCEDRGWAEGWRAPGELHCSRDALATWFGGEGQGDAVGGTGVGG